MSIVTHANSNYSIVPPEVGSSLSQLNPPTDIYVGVMVFSFYFQVLMGLQFTLMGFTIWVCTTATLHIIPMVGI